MRAAIVTTSMITVTKNGGNPKLANCSKALKYSTLLLVTLLLFGNHLWGVTLTVHVTDTAAQFYTTVEGAACGDIVEIESGTYNKATGNLPQITLAGKNCTSGSPLIIRAQSSAARAINGTGKPLLDYSGDQIENFPASGTASNRGAWTIANNGATNSSYVIIDGLYIKGVHSNSSQNAAAIRTTSTSGTNNDHITVRNCTIENSENGLFGSVFYATYEYNQFLGNGANENDQSHQIYNGGGDNTVIRYNYFNDLSCCIKGLDGSIIPGAANIFAGTVNTSGTAATWVSGDTFTSGMVNLFMTIGGTGCFISAVSDSTHLTVTSCTPGTLTGAAFTILGAGGGQNIHNRACNSWIYGNWMQDASDYEIDMSTPDPAICPNNSSTTMSMYMFGNVIVPNKVMAAGSYGANKIATFVGDATGFASGHMSLTYVWNTLYYRSPNVASVGTNPGSPDGYAAGVFQVNNDSAGTFPVGAINLTNRNNVFHMVAVPAHYQTWFFVNGTGVASLSGSYNWFDSAASVVNSGVSGDCSSGGTQSWAAGNITCLLTNTTTGSQSSPPFNTASASSDPVGWNLKPSSAGAFGSADTTVTVPADPYGVTKPPLGQYTPMTFQTLSSWTDIGAAQYQSPNGYIQTSNTVRTAGTVMQ